MRILLNPPAITNSIVPRTSKICGGTQLNDTIIGKYTYLGYNCFAVNAEIGNYCSIADNCRIGGATHNMEYVSTSPVFIQGKNCLKKNFSNHNSVGILKTMIGSDVWIGANTIIISGVQIGTGSVIGAGSVVTHNVPPYEIWAGNPAKKIRDRFDNEIKKELLLSKWWSWDDAEILKQAVCFDNVEDFLEKKVFNEDCSLG